MNIPKFTTVGDARNYAAKLQSENNEDMALMARYPDNNAIREAGQRRINARSKVLSEIFEILRNEHSYK